ncbi:hypothetical protein HG537_0D03370 [Torulaspora globosa]|uniref:non-specific serine/threonine protein kinase n=1 Tax=Torulaspora globosa TaxID=48254 RepID=A0A7H9HTA9_9SACH|nr:hypothetical protein HG537_0D03370 [Torulaspora sp. CBS 2947]
MDGDERVNLTPAQQVDQNGVVTPLLNPRQRKNQVQYQLKQVIGKGSYGIVYKAINRKTEQVVAIKEVTYDDDEELTDIMSEIGLLKNLNHINIVKYHGFIKKSHNLYIILEYCSRGSLKNAISRGRGIPESKAKIFVKQTLNGLRYLHEQGVIHRDIKAANLLLDANNVVKLADFGVSTKVSTMSMAMTLAGSLNWMAPEIIGNRGASTLSDIWSLGATVLELLTGSPPFHNLVDVNIYYAIENDTFIPPASLSQDAQEFLLNCFQKNMYKRPTAAQLLKHKWLSNADADRLELFREECGDLNYRWDHDFKDSTILNNHKSEQHKLESHDYLNDYGEQTVLKSAGELLKRDNISMLSDDNVKMIFDQLGVESIYLKIMDEVRENPELLFKLLRFDKKFYASDLKRFFMKMGGIETVLDRSDIISEFFLKDEYKTLIQCGILRKDNLQKLDDPVKLELIFRLLEISGSVLFWCNWCSHNLSVATLISNLQNKYAQSIILKLSLLQESSSWFHEQFMDRLTRLDNVTALDQQLISFLFKALSSILIKSHRSSSSSTTRSLPYSPTSSQTSVNSLASTTSKPASSSVQGNPLILPPKLLPWMLDLLNDDSFFNIKNLHLWKYYFLVIHHSTHLDKVRLNKLHHSQKFLQLIWRLLYVKDDPSFFHKECQGPVVQLSLSIITELSLEMDTFNPLLQHLALTFLKYDDECIAGGLEILFNHLQFALHHNFKVIQTIKGFSIIAPNIGKSASAFSPKEFNNVLEYQELINPFFNIHEDNLQFGNFIAKFIKIYSLGPCDAAAMSLVLDSEFAKRSIFFFEQYCNSLLIQIDLLKFIKLVFSRALEYFEFKKRSDEPLNDDVLKCILMKLQEMNVFLENNWNSQQPGQVGCDSILIHQLCHDIQALLLETPSSLSATRNSAFDLDTIAD